MVPSPRNIFLLKPREREREREREERECTTQWYVTEGGRMLRRSLRSSLRLGIRT